MATNGEHSPTGSPRSASTSLQAAATLNASLQHEPSRRSSGSSITRNRSSPQAGQRRSTVLMNLQLNDPGVPAPGEMQDPQRLSPHSLSVSPFAAADPHHHRAPSLGELHQELEAEQEAHVNRLLQMIRQQQLELQRLQATPHGGPSADEMSAVSERSNHGMPPPVATQPSPSLSSAVPVGSYSRSPVLTHPRSSFDMARADLHRRSRTPSRGASPRLRSTSISAESGDWVLGGRDESAFYQAETQMLVRENQMLRHRIRELEKQLSDVSNSPVSTEPPVPSHLHRSSTAEEEPAPKDA